MKLFAIEDQATGRLLPLHRIAMTRVEFGDPGPPRLFTKRGHAQQALDCWRMGEWRLEGDEDGYSPVPYYGSANDARAAARKAMDIKVVEFELVRHG